MNIFVSDENPVLCAQYLDDKRVGKLLMEQCQMLSLAIKLCDPDGDWEEGEGMLTRGFPHKNHPCSIWVRANQSNFNWTICHAQALNDEWIHRRGTQHGSGERLPYIRSKGHCLPEGDLLPFQNSARNAGKGIDYSHLPVVEAYRQYLAHRWDTDTMPVTWTNRGEPEWLSSIPCV